MGPLLSIVVPTKNRFYYLEFLIRYFHSIDSDKIELIIQDNSDLELTPKFLLFLNEINDQRIKYFYSSLELSQTENCNNAILNACGEYISLLGDDDIFSIHLIEFIETCKNKSVEAILPIKGLYTWPDVQPRFYKNNLSGIFRVNRFSRRIINIDVKSELKKVITIGGIKILNLPRVYHGVVKRSVLDLVFQESGSYCPGPSPDIANAVALCKHDINCITIDVPLIISGQSILSAGGKGAQGQHFGDISKIEQLGKDTATNWSSKVPFYWSGYTIYTESVIKALTRMNMSHLLEELNYEYLYASCLVFDTNYRKRVIDVMKKNNLNILNFKMIRIFFYFIVIWIKRIIFHMKHNLILLMPELFKHKNTIFHKQNIWEVAILNDEMIEKELKKL